MFGSSFGKTWFLLIIVLLVCLLLISLSGCYEYEQREAMSIDGAINLFKSLQTANTVSTPVNPLALPIGAGLAGLVAMLEALRRVEKGKRKFAEHTLNNNTNNHS